MKMDKMSDDIPEWLIAYVRLWQDRLCLRDWTIRVVMSLCVGDDPNILAMCRQHPDMNEVTLDFRADIENTPNWRRTVIHELLHARHSRVDHAVEQAILPEVGPLTQQIARVLYHQHVESFVAFMAEMLYAETRARDFPEEQHE